MNLHEKFDEEVKSVGPGFARLRQNDLIKQGKQKNHYKRDLTPEQVTREFRRPG